MLKIDVKLLSYYYAYNQQPGGDNGINNAKILFIKKLKKKTLCFDNTMG